MITVEHETAEGRRCSVDVYESTLADKLRKANLAAAAAKASRDDDPSGFNVFVQLMELHTHPSCVSCSRNFADTDESMDGVTTENMTFEHFATLPEQFVEKWAQAVFEVNPGWREDAFFPQVRPSRRREKPKSS